MEIKFLSRNDLKYEERKNFYDEAVYIYAYIRRVKKNPGGKVYLITKYFTRLEAFAISFGILIALFMYMFNRSDILLSILFGMYLIIFIYLGIVLVIYKKYITKFITEDRDAFIKLSKEEINYYDGDKTEKVGNILFNDHTITVVSNTVLPVLLFVPIKYKDEILKEVKALGYESLVVDNSK